MKMIDHAGKSFNDAPLRPYGMTKRVVNNFYADECEVMIVSGMPEGVGKSAYVNHVFADAKGYQQCRDSKLVEAMRLERRLQIDAPKWSTDYENIKPLILYEPKDVVDKCLYMLDHNEREYALEWDDGGTWLNAMEYQEPFVVAFMEYLSLARSNWAAIVITTPVEGWVLKKLRTAEGLIKVQISKPENAAKYYWKPRKAIAYKVVNLRSPIRRFLRNQ